uniref:Uncharacterized protein n=1 Tax=Anopheles atroparvus TaxID=41427 RepID=A0A182JAA6_ANOAO
MNGFGCMASTVSSDEDAKRQRPPMGHFCFGVNAQERGGKKEVVVEARLHQLARNVDIFGSRSSDVRVTRDVRGDDGFASLMRSLESDPQDMLSATLLVTLLLCWFVGLLRAG